MGRALWEVVPDSIDSESLIVMGRKNVSSILMREHDDIAYCSLLRRLRMDHTIYG